MNTAKSLVCWNNPSLNPSKAVMEHAEAKRMIADIKRGHITGLIFSKLARLARNTKELLEFADLFRRHGNHVRRHRRAVHRKHIAARRVAGRHKFRCLFVSSSEEGKYDHVTSNSSFESVIFSTPTA